MFGGEVHHLRAVVQEHPIRQDQDRVRPLLDDCGKCAIQNTATCESLGLTSLSSSNRFPSSSGAIELNPVIFPPGRARLATMPATTGSPTAIMTMGTEVVAFLTARVAVIPEMHIRSTECASITRTGSRVAGDAIAKSQSTRSQTTQSDSMFLAKRQVASTAFRQILVSHYGLVDTRALRCLQAALFLLFTFHGRATLRD